jgi:serine/threonine protein kinase/tetratricopeptide (TPR) repeat protein
MRAGDGVEFVKTVAAETQRVCPGISKLHQQSASRTWASPFSWSIASGIEMIGQRLSHYQIVEKIGAGGMGVVYRAHDEQLDRDVAIKVLPPGTLADEAAHKRFRKEALSLARLNHPNIATVHEFGSQDGVDFLVTEYIAGITLDAKLARGPLAPAEVIRLGVQLAEGLAAAHEQGIVHRDLKPGNLRLTTDGRLKILDFGLAEIMPQASADGVTATLTRSHETSGTLPYMSPEQLSGEMADARSDIWAAGAVLYEMATGKRPFLQTVPALLINAILNQTPEPPSKINPALPAGLDAVIVKALARDPAWRHPSAGDLAVDLERSASPSSRAVPIQPALIQSGPLQTVQLPSAQVQPASPSSRRQLAALVAGLAFLALAAAGYFFFLKHRNPPSNAAPAVSRRRSIAVLGFKNLSENPEKSWLSTAISEMLTTELSQGDQLRTIPGESVAQMKASLALSDADSFSEQTLTRIHQNLGSDDVVLGSYLPLGNGLLRLDLRLQDAVAGVTLASVSEKGSEAEIDDLVSKAGTELRAKLGIGPLSEAQSAVVRASLPSNPEAARLYSEGLQKLRLFDAQAARGLLEKSAALDSEYASTHSALAEAWSTLGYDAKAKDQAKQALALSAKSSREERLLIEGRAHELLAQNPEAVESYRALWEFFPDNVDYGLLLNRAQVAAGHGSEAEATLANLRKLTVSEADAARIDLAEVNIANLSNDFKRQQELAERAAVRGRAVGASLLVARALQLESAALERMGDSKKTLELASEAKQLFDSAGDRKGSAREVLFEGDLLFDEGNYPAAQKQFEIGLAVFQEIGANRAARAALERIGNVYYAEGRLQEAVKDYKQALASDRELNDQQGVAGDLGNLANALDGLGDIQGSLKMQQESLAIFNQLGDRRGASTTMYNLGNLYVETGNLEDAQKNYDQGLAITREISYRRGEPYPLAGSGDVLLARGDFPEARKRYEEALALCKELDDEDFAAQINASLATIALFEKRYSDGEALARQAFATYEKTNSAGNEAWVQAVLARNLLGQGRLPDAQAAVTKATALVRQTTLRAPLFEVTMAEARVKAKSGQTAEALQSLQTQLSSARKFGYLLYEYQLRLAIGEIDLWSGSASAASSLSALEKDAREHGAGFVANQAQALQTEHHAKGK